MSCPYAIDPRHIGEACAECNLPKCCADLRERLTRTQGERDYFQKQLAIAEPLGKERAPIAMRLTCPDCAMLHIDEGEFATKPHHTHACQSCGCVWRPAIVATVGVRFLPGFRNGCTFQFGDGQRCVSKTCHLDGKHFTEGVIP
jgi:hypothetical protein